MKRLTDMLNWYIYKNIYFYYSCYNYKTNMYYFFKNQIIFSFFLNLIKYYKYQIYWTLWFYNIQYVPQIIYGKWIWCPANQYFTQSNLNQLTIILNQYSTPIQYKYNYYLNDRFTHLILNKLLNFLYFYNFLQYQLHYLKKL